MATAAATLTIRPLSVDELASDALAPMVRRHWDETAAGGLREMAPDWLRYRALEQRDMLFGLAAEIGGAIVGYTMGSVGPDMGDRLLCGYTNAFVYVDPAHRGIGIGTRLIAETRREAMLRGAQIEAWHARGDSDLARRLTKLGCKAREVVFEGVL